MSIKTQGTQVYFVNTLVDATTQALSYELIEIDCPTALSASGESIEQIETTCLKSTVRTYVGGLATPGEATLTVNYDHTDDSLLQLKALHNSSEITTFVIGFSNGVADPTISATTGVVTYPTDRSYLAFDAYVMSFPFSFELNNVVTSEIGLQVTGKTNLYNKI